MTNLHTIAHRERNAAFRPPTIGRPATRFSVARADRLRDQLTESEEELGDGWTYQVVVIGDDCATVEAYDEDGCYAGTF